MKRFKSIVLAALAVFLVAAYIPVGSISAQSSSLSIAPKKNYTIDPGGSINDKLSIRNIDTTDELQLYLRVIDFTYTDDSGTPKLMLDGEADPTTWSLRPYLDVPESITVNPSSTATVDIGVDIPQNLGAGSYYSAIIYSTSAPDGGNVGLAASGVTLVFVDVPGQVNEDLTLKQFGAYDKDRKAYTFIALNEPQIIAYTLENKGNVAEAPVGSITLRGMFGQQYRITEVNPKKSLALIGQTRTFQACIKLNEQKKEVNGEEAREETCASPGLWPGMYTASAELYYGQNGNYTRDLTKTVVFWYLPLWFIIIFTLVVLVIAFYVWRTVVWMRGGSFKLGGRPRQRKSRRRH